MTGPVPPKTRTERATRLLLGMIAAVGAAMLVACGPETFEIPIETPIQPKLSAAPSTPVPWICQLSAIGSYRCGAPLLSMAHIVPSQPAAMSTGAPNVSVELIGLKLLCVAC